MSSSLPPFLLSPSSFWKTFLVKVNKTKIYLLLPLLVNIELAVPAKIRKQTKKKYSTSK